MKSVRLIQNILNYHTLQPEGRFSGLEERGSSARSFMGDRQVGAPGP